MKSFTTIRNYTTLKQIQVTFDEETSFTTIRNYTTLKQYNRVIA